MSVGKQKNSMSYDSTNGASRYRFTLGEVLSWNIDIDVIVGNGWTRITLREIPRFLVDALDFITENGLQIDGIFRREGNSARLNRPEVLEVYRGVRPIPSDFTVLDVCTMVKRFLKDLKPTILSSDDVRMNVIRKAKKARITGEFELTHREMVEIFESTPRQLPAAHLGTLGYVMRLLSRIARHSDTHKMTTDNLAVVLVGSVFGDFMAGGGTESRKKMQQVRKCTEAELQSKKEDMGVQVAAVKLLIVNANLIGLPHGHYVSSNRLHLNSHMNIRSTSAMPNIRCPSVSENEQMPSSSTAPQVFSMAKASMMHQNHPNASPGTPKRPTLRSSSFLPIQSLRGLRDRVSSQFLKRNKSPSPDKPRRVQIFKQPMSPFYHHEGTSSSLPPPPPPPLHSTPQMRRAACGADSDSENIKRGGDANRSSQKKGSTSSGRKSRTHTKKGNINSMKDRFDSDSQKSFQMSPNPTEKRSSISSTSSTNRSLRRFSQSEQNSFQRGDATPPKRRRAGVGVTRRNTGDGLQENYDNRRPSRRSTFWGVDTITEEKENRQSMILIDSQRSEEEDPIEKSGMEDTIGGAESVLELMNSQARQRRIGVAERRQRRLATNTGPSESMMVLNGSIATFEKLPPVSQEKKVDKKPVEKTMNSPSKSQKEYPVIFQTPVRTREERRPKFMISSPKSKIGQQLEREMKQRLDVVATPMLSRRAASESVAQRIQMSSPEPLSAIPLRKLDSIGLQKNGHVWVGKSQTVVSSPVQRSDVQEPKVSPILARSPLFRSPSSVTPTIPSAKTSPFFGIRSKSHLTEDRIFSNQEYAGLATPPRERRLHSRPARLPQSNLIYSSPTAIKSATPSSTDHHLTTTSSSLPLTRSSSLMNRPITDNRYTALMAISPLAQPSQNDSQLFKCPVLPPMKSHESRERKKNPSGSSAVSTQQSSNPSTPRASLQLMDINTSDQGFGDFNEILRNSTEETKFPLVHQIVEARPSVTALRSSACGLVQSRINHFQTIERSSISNQRMSTDLSSGGRQSTTSLKSVDTTNSSAGRI
uniref:Rho-GAP domain-containing protein n=1 Tax=Caenorhabditis tropicalis TaxID=1561998 RepID=A0A1I7TQT6_9PELO